RGYSLPLKRALTRIFTGRRTCIVLTICLIVVMFLFGQLIVKLRLNEPSQLLVGSLRNKNLEAPTSGAFELALWLTMGAWICVAASQTALRVWKALPVSTYLGTVYVMLFGFAILTTAFLPISYGISKGRDDYRLCQLQVQGSKNKICGLEILQSSNQILYWHA